MGEPHWMEMLGAAIIVSCILMGALFLGSLAARITEGLLVLPL